LRFLDHVFQLANHPKPFSAEAFPKSLIAMRPMLSIKAQLVQRFRFRLINSAALAGINLPSGEIYQIYVFASVSVGKL